MRLFLITVRLLVLSLLLASQLIADAHAENSAASVKCIDIPDGLSSDDLIALCTSVIETEKDLPAARLAQALHARGVGYKRKKDFDKAIADFKKALEVLPPGSDEHFRQILMSQRDSSIDDKKAAAAAAAANADNWLMFLVFVAGVFGVWAISFRTRIGALAYGTAGRISRSDYWYALLAVVAVAAVQGLAMLAAMRLGVSPLGPIAGLIFLVGWVAAIVLAATVVSIKRLHDRNRSAWVVVAGLVLVLFAARFAGKFYLFWYQGTPLVMGDLSVLLVFSLAGLVHVTAPLGAVMLVESAPKFVSSVRDGFWDGATAYYILDFLLGTILIAVGLWFFWEVGLRRGTVGPNRFGPDPLA